MHFSHPDAIQSPFHLWCTGGHYQAVIPLVKVKIRKTAAQSHAFRESIVLDKKDVLAAHDE